MKRSRQGGQQLGHDDILLQQAAVLTTAEQTTCAELHEAANMDQSNEPSSARVQTMCPADVRAVDHSLDDIECWWSAFDPRSMSTQCSAASAELVNQKDDQIAHF
jgi:hypothetical protein